MADLRAVHSSVIDQVDTDLRTRVAPLLDQPVVVFDGLDLLAQIVSGSSQEVERQLLTDMAARDAEAAERVRDVLFVFEDIVRLNDHGVQELLKNVDTRQLAVASRAPTRPCRRPSSATSPSAPGRTCATRSRSCRGFVPPTSARPARRSCW